MALEAVVEAGRRVLSGGDAVHEVVDLVYERVLPADDVSAGPPAPDERVRLIGDENRLPALDEILVFAAEELDLVHALEVEADASIAAVELEMVAVPVAGSEAGGLEGAYRAVLEPRQEKGRVVNSDFAHLPGRFCTQSAGLGGKERALLDEGFHHPADGFELAAEIPRQVNNVRVQIAVRAGAGLILLQPPDERELRINDPILQINGAEVIGGPDHTALDHPLGQRNRRNHTVVEVDHVDDAGLFHGLDHLAALGDAHGHRLLAEDVPAALRSGEADLHVRIVAGTDIHEVNVFRLEEPCIALAAPCPAILPGTFLRFGFH